jgi:hypothetical protein
MTSNFRVGRGVVKAPKYGCVQDLREYNLREKMKASFRNLREMKTSFQKS